MSKTQPLSDVYVDRITHLAILCLKEWVIECIEISYKLGMMFIEIRCIVFEY